MSRKPRFLRLPQLYIMVAMTGLVVAFQNCGPMQMQAEFNSLDGVEIGPDGQMVSVPPTMISIPDDEPDGSRSGPERELPELAESHASDTHFVCILNVAGKSHRISLVGGRLGAQTSTPDTVCMSRRACLEVVAQAFDVVSAERRGYCAGEVSRPRARVVHVNDEDISRLVSN